MGKKFIIYSLLVFVVCQVCAAQRKEGLLSDGFPKGTRIYKPDKCWNGYTLVPYENGMIILIDMKGNVVHSWEIGTERARLLENGNVVVMQGSSILEYDWDGKVVWEYEVPGGPYRGTGYPSVGFIHHDLQRLSNGNTIFIYHEEVPEQYKKVIKDPVRRSTQIIGDCFLEVNKEKEVVWQWHAHEYLDLNEDSSIQAREGRRFDWTHANTVGVLPENHWYDEGHKAFRPGNVIICSRQLDEIYIIDRDTKEVVWKYRGEYLGGISRAHEPYMIEKGMPGAGNIIMFDNGTDRKESNRDGKGEDAQITVVLEINPVSKQIVWLYQDGTKFYSAIQGTQQRLHNGNTFICESTTGRLFEVTYDGEIVWEYVMPPFPGSDEEHGFGTRPHRYPYDYCPQLKKMPTPAGKETFTNPLLPSGADPWIFYHEGFYYYTNTLGRRIGIWRTEDITELRNAEYKTIYVPPENTMYSKQLWAPEIININDNWYVYFAADDGDNLNHKLYVLENTSDDPFEGEFKMKGKIKTDKDDNWAIDGSVFYHRGDYYFIWSGWQTSPYVDVETQCIYIAKMKNPWTLATDRVLISKPEYEWERIWKNPDEWNNMPDHIVYVNEGPEVLAHGNKLFLVYSASGCWTPYYALGMLTADADSDLLNPKSWKKHPEPVFHQSEENGVYGTGHNCFFKSPDGTEDWILYHANDKPEQGCGGKRSPRAQLIKWNDDGTPNFGTALSTSTRIKKPSGIK